MYVGGAGGAGGYTRRGGGGYKEEALEDQFWAVDHAIGEVAALLSAAVLLGARVQDKGRRL